MEDVASRNPSVVVVTEDDCISFVAPEIRTLSAVREELVISPLEIVPKPLAFPRSLKVTVLFFIILPVDPSKRTIALLTDDPGPVTSPVPPPPPLEPHGKLISILIFRVLLSVLQPSERTHAF